MNFFLHTLEEETWCHEYQHLLDHGYELRPRYRPGWTPQWSEDESIVEIVKHEDSIVKPYGPILDAKRLSDGSTVILKRLAKDEYKTNKYQNEVEISKFFSSEALRDHPDNHCVPILDVIEESETSKWVFLVMPVLRPYNNPPFETLNNVVDFMRQYLRGVRFMHSHNVAHLDGVGLNIMLDATPLYPEGFHPSHQNFHPTRIIERAPRLSRLDAPVSYYFIDFGISFKFPSREAREKVTQIMGRELTTPELSQKAPYDPFPVDIYIAGRLLYNLIKDVRGLEHFDDLFLQMAAFHPRLRPDAWECVELCESLVGLIPRGLLNTPIQTRNFFTRLSLQFNDLWQKYILGV
jgi:serine/threonine protein kinase